MQTNLAVEQNNGPRVRGISLVGKEKVYRGKDLPKSQVLRSEWKTERVREDENGDSEDGEEDDECIERTFSLCPLSVVVCLSLSL